MERGHTAVPHLTARPIGAAPRTIARRLYYDTVLHSPEAIRFLIDTVGVDRVLLGSDYPFEMGDPDPVTSVDAVPGLSEDERQAILGERRRAARCGGWSGGGRVGHRWRRRAGTAAVTPQLGHKRAMANAPMTQSTPPDTTENCGDVTAATAPASRSPSRGPPLTTAPWMAESRPVNSSGTVNWRMVFLKTADMTSAAPATASSER